jgi:hypothetical protein
MPIGHAHARPLAKETRSSLTRPQLPPRARGLPRALGSRSTASSVPTLYSCPANDASQGPGTRRQALGYHAQGVPGITPKACPCQLLFRQGHVRGMTQEDKASHGLRELGDFWARASTLGADLLRHKEDSRRSHPGEAGPSRHRLTHRVSE